MGMSDSIDTILNQLTEKLMMEGFTIFEDFAKDYTDLFPENMEHGEAHKDTYFQAWKQFQDKFEGIITSIIERQGLTTEHFTEIIKNNKNTESGSMFIDLVNSLSD